MEYVKTIYNFKHLFFDFDGVLFNSNKIRTKGFKIIFKEFPKTMVDKLVDYHEINGGSSRYHKIRYFFENILNKDISDELLQTYANEYREVMSKELFDEKLKISDSINFLKTKRKKFIKIYIVSGSDQNELRSLCEFLEIKDLFNGIYGSPIAKNDLVKNILKKNSLKLKDCCLIGDSLNDKEAALINDITFFAYNNHKLNEYDTIKTFASLI
jgi:HAD superfamily hydrolase (TIGR01549 family)